MKRCVICRQQDDVYPYVVYCYEDDQPLGFMLFKTQTEARQYKEEYDEVEVT